MEVVAYIVGASVEIDLLPQNQEIRKRGLSDWLATVAGDDASNATRAVVKRYRSNSIYWQNYRTESRVPGQRIPTEHWSHWLIVLGFEANTIEHIRQLSAVGTAKLISKDELENGN